MTFDEHYQKLYGDEWTELKNALLKPRRHVARVTRKGNGFDVLGSEISTVMGIPGCFDPRDFEIQETLCERPDSFYLMDLGSVIAARSLLADEASSYWDICAAPGGKSLILLEQFDPVKGTTLTDLSRPRLEKLKQVIRQYHGDDVFAFSSLKLSAADGVDWGYRHQQQYDRVLLDAPCSSERHVLLDEQALRQWTPNRVKILSKRQYGLLCSAVLACKTGGRILYSTCSIHPDENDAVIDRYLKKKGDVRILPIDSPIGRNTEHGVMIRPDLDDEWGPMYFTLMERL